MSDTSEELYKVLKGIIPELPDDAVKIILTLEVDKLPVLDVTREIKIGTNLVHGQHEKFNLKVIE